jgi:hypothetical protein
MRHKLDLQRGMVRHWQLKPKVGQSGCTCRHDSDERQRAVLPYKPGCPPRLPLVQGSCCWRVLLTLFLAMRLRLVVLLPRFTPVRSHCFSVLAAIVSVEGASLGSLEALHARPPQLGHPSLGAQRAAN